MQDIRAIIKQRMADAGLSNYRLHLLVAEHISQATLNRYLRGDIELTAPKLAALLDALELEIRARG